MATRATVAGEAAAGPAGVGLGVAIDWALGAQILSGAAFSLGLGLTPAITRGANPVATIGGSLVGAAACFALGEGLRQGRQWARWTNIVLGFGIIGGALLLDIPHLIAGASHHNFWALYPAVIELVVGPYMATRLLRPQTAAWFAGVSAATARARHGSAAWLLGVASLAITGGIITQIARIFE